MSGFVVLVEFHLKPGTGARFLEEVTVNAAASVRDEPGCRRFDVLTEIGGSPDQVILYEIYDDEAAFEAHKKTPHYAAFRQSVDAIVERTELRTCDVRENAA